MIGKRKILIAAKKNRLFEDAAEKLNQAKCSPEHSWSDIVKDEDFLKITSFCQNPQTAVKMLGRIIQTVPEIKGPRIDEDERSEQFWARNRKLENDIDTILEKLKTIDKQVSCVLLSWKKKTERSSKSAEIWTESRILSSHLWEPNRQSTSLRSSLFSTPRRKTTISSTAGSKIGRSQRTKRSSSSRGSGTFLSSSKEPERKD